MTDELFLTNYQASRQRFRGQATRLGWEQEAFEVAGAGPAGESLTVDIACSPGEAPQSALVVSSGLHGVEAPFGTAVQARWMQQLSENLPPLAETRILLIHALNPYGFAWWRRFNEENVDLNRNFLGSDESFRGSHPAYPEIDRLLNPPHPPRRFPPLWLEALPVIMRVGLPSLRQAIAGGQYDFPRGLFFGGEGPARSQAIVREILRRWLTDVPHVTHFDFHTGLGRFGNGMLLLDSTPTRGQLAWLHENFEPEEVETPDEKNAYQARGSLGAWCRQQLSGADYLYACAEFGTYTPMKIVSGLRAENQLHHWDDRQRGLQAREKQRLLELFCPAQAAWRHRVLTTAVQWLDRCLFKPRANGSVARD